MPNSSILELNTRQKIVNAALSVAAREGFAHATTHEIARVAGVSEGIIYHYFKSKHDLCFNMIKERSEEFRVKMIDEISGLQGARAKLERLIDFNFLYFTKKGNIFQAIYGKSGDSKIMMNQILKVAIMPYAKIIEGIVSFGIEQGEFKTVQAGIAATTLLGMMQLNIIRLHFGESGYSVDDVKANVKDIFFGGLLK